MKNTCVCVGVGVGVCVCGPPPVNGVSTVAEAVGERLAPHVKKHTAKLIPESLKKSKDGQASSMDGAKLVAVTSLQGRGPAAGVPRGPPPTPGDWGRRYGAWRPCGPEGGR